MSPRRLIPLLAVALLAAWAPAAAAVPVDASDLGVPVYAPGCETVPPSAPDCVLPGDTTIASPTWVTAAVAYITLDGDDSGSGLARIEYAEDGGDITSGADNEVVDITGEGAHSLAHRAVDVDGNASGWVLDSFGIDSIAPVNTTLAPDPAPASSRTVTVNATDGGSGIRFVHWQIDGAPAQSGPAGSQVTISTDGPHTLRTWAEDVAGNLSAWRDDPVTIDAGKPVDTSVISGAWRTASPTSFVLQGTDGADPATRMEYTVDGGAVQSVANLGTVSLGGEGVFTIMHRAVDAVGNVSDWAPSTVRIDTTLPQNTTTASAAWQDPDHHVIVQGTDATSGIALVEWQVDGGPIQNATSTKDVLVTGEGPHTVATRVTDTAGNRSAWRTDTVKIDTAPPVDLTSAPAGWQKSAITVQVNGYDAGSGVASVAWSLDGGPITTVPAATTNVVVPGEGQHTLTTQVTDALGHATGWKSHPLAVDTTAPGNTTATPPTAWQNGPVAVKLTGGDGGSGLARMEWMIDSGAPQSGPTDSVVSISTDGAHTLQTRAVDVAGNASGWRSDTIQIDSVKPTDTTTVPAAIKYGGTVAITGTDGVPGPVTAQWRLDGVDATGPSGSLVTLTAKGPHTIEHRVLDQAGNASPWKSDPITVDTALNNDSALPVDTTTVPSGWSQADVTVEVQGTDDTGIDYVEWREDGGSKVRGANHATFTVSGDGQHHFETRVVDLLGKATPFVDRVVKIDAARPVDTTSIPDTERTGSVTITGTDAHSGIAQMEWTIDGGARQSGPSGSAVALTDGTHTVAHRAVDVAENVSAWTYDTVTIDTQAPVDTTPPAPAGWQTSAWTVTPSGTDTGGSGVQTVEARLDGDPVTTSPVVVDTDGDHTFETRITDVAGNDSGWRSQNVKIDLHAPTDTTTAVPAGWRSAPWTGTVSADDGAGSGVTGVEWKLGAAGTISGTASVSIAAEGVTVLMTRATDAVGHVSAWRSQTVRIDTVAPTATLDCGSTAWRTSTPTCTVGAAGGPSGIGSLIVTRNGGAARSVAPGGKVAVDADGTWTVKLAAADGAGNAASVSRIVKVDRTPPRAALACVPSKAATGYACTAAGSDATSGLATLRWRVGGGAWQAPGAGGTFSVASGTVQVRATDVAGLAAVAPVSVLTPRTPAAPAGDAKVRSRSVAVKRRGSRGTAGLLGAFELRSERLGRTASGTADVRPLSLGKGRFRVSIRLESGQLTAKRVRVMSFKRGGWSPRMGVALTGVRKKMRAHLVVEKRTGRRWRAFALADATLKP